MYVCEIKIPSVILKLWTGPHTVLASAIGAVVYSVAVCVIVGCFQMSRGLSERLSWR